MTAQIKTEQRDFPGGPVAKTPHFECRGVWVQFLVGELRSRMLCGTVKKI